MKINVSQKDIDKGVRGDSTKCALVRAATISLKHRNIVLLKKCIQQPS